MMPPKMQKMFEGSGKDKEKKPAHGKKLTREGSKAEVTMDMSQLVKKKGS